MKDDLFFTFLIFLEINYVCLKYGRFREAIKSGGLNFPRRFMLNDSINGKGCKYNFAKLLQKLIFSPRISGIMYHHHGFAPFR